jgi:hypothetical protein
MPQPYGKAVTNESIYPNIVELAITAGGLEVELARRIMEFSGDALQILCFAWSRGRRIRLGI